MKKIDWLQILIIQAVILLSGSLIAMLWFVGSLFRQSLTVLAFASVLALILHPAVQALERLRIPRWIAVLLIYLTTIVLLVFTVLYLYEPVLDQLELLIINVPSYTSVWQQRTLEWQEELLAYGISLDWPEIGNQYLNQLRNLSLSILSNTLGIISRISGFVTDLVLVFVLSIYLLIDYPRMVRMIERLQSPQREFIRTVAGTTNRIFGRYIRGQIILGIIIGICVWVGMTLLGMPYPVLLAIVAGIFELVPMFGAVLGALPALVIALFMPWPKLLFVAVFFIILQQLEGNVLVPRITGQAIGLRPAVTLLALLAGYELGGIWGSIFAAPVVAILFALFMGLSEAANVWRQGEKQEEPTPPRFRKKGSLFSRFQRKFSDD